MRRCSRAHWKPPDATTSSSAILRPAADTCCSPSISTTLRSTSRSIIRCPSAGLRPPAPPRLPGNVDRPERPYANARAAAFDPALHLAPFRTPFEAFFLQTRRLLFVPRLPDLQHDPGLVDVFQPLRALP